MVTANEVNVFVLLFLIILVGTGAIGLVFLGLQELVIQYPIHFTSALISVLFVVGWVHSSSLKAFFNKS
ncbi:Uncharacterised protein [uncultured archaeon]|nr:Uncharacterised protein [uncultured archaeon]